jgi:peptidoglycan/xylan/chitin deacetylase (PgdA/CDA1 family)
MARHHLRALGQAGAVASAAAIGYWLPAAAIVSARLRRAFDVHAEVPSDGVVLTFDDGPHPEGTPAILDTLARLDLPAVFFLVGEQVERYASIASDIVAAGHQVGLHCHRHRNLMRLTPWQVRNDLSRATDVITRAVERKLDYYRPPYGILTAAAITTARRLECETILWSRDGRDWEAAATPESISRRILPGLRPGHVVLLHDADHYATPGSWRQTLASLDPLAEALARLELPVRRMPASPFGRPQPESARSAR